MITKLTKEQEAAIIPHRNFWLNYVWSCANSNTDREKAAKGIEWLYKYCGKEKPTIFFMDSPMGVQVVANMLRGNSANIGANIRGNIGDNIGDNIGANIRGNIGGNIGDNKLEYISFSDYGNIRDFGWVAYIDYFFQMKMVSSDREKDFNYFKDLLLSGIFDMVQFENVCIVSALPNVIHRDEQNRLHSITGNAVEFRDGWGQHYIHGRCLPYDKFESISSGFFTSEMFFTEENEEVKSACIAMMQELYGEEYVFNFFRENLKEVDSYIDKKDEQYLVGTTGGMNVGVYTLFNGRINGEDVAYVRCYCPSTDRMFFLGVEPIHNKAKDAIASLYRVPAKLKKHIKAIHRQGERFCTIFDEVGTSLLPKMNPDDLQNTTTITGDEYFSLIKYEY